MAIPTLADVAKFSPNVQTELIDEAAVMVPEFSVLPWKAVKGYTYSTLVRTALPVAGFRAANAGTDAVKSTYDNRTITLGILNPRWECDVAVAKSCVDGENIYIANEAYAQVQAAIKAAGYQMWYGTGTNGVGFAGLAGQVDADMIVNANGDTADSCASAYILSAGRPDHLTWVLGQDGDFTQTDLRIESVADEDGKRFSAYVQEIVAWVGCQLGHAYAVVRVANLDSDHGLTDDLVFQGFSLLEAQGLAPSHIFTTAAQKEALRKSRTATNATGAPAPTVTEVGGIPLFSTLSLVNTEAVYTVAPPQGG